MYPWPARLRLREATLQSALLRETFDRSSLPRMPHYHAAGGVISALDAASLAPFGNGYGPCGVAIRSASMAGYARASGGQGYVQLSSMAEPFRKLCRLSGIVTPHFGVEDI